MGLIINQKISQLMKGYPTVSDKYNVQGGIADETVSFGDAVAFTGTTGHYKKYAGADFAGIVVSTNVKLVNVWPAGENAEAETLKGEAFGLLMSGFIAVELDATLADFTNKVADSYGIERVVPVLTTAGAAAIKEGAKLYIKADGTFTPVAAGATEINAKLTGIYELKGGKVIAEVMYNM